MTGRSFGALLGLPITVAGHGARLLGDAAGRAGGTVADLVDFAEDVAEEAAERMTTAADTGSEWAEELASEWSVDLGTVAEESQDLFEDALGVHRRVWQSTDGYAVIEVRGIGDREAGGLRRALREVLQRADAVRWAEVNAITRKITLAFDPERTPLDSLVGLVEGVEAAHGVAARRDDDLGWEQSDRSDHPADVEPIHRSIAVLAGNGLALGLAVAGRITRLPRIPVEVAAVTSLVDHVPWARQRAESLVGKRAVDLVIPLVNASANGIAQGPMGILVDLAHHTSQLTELRARHRVWERREPHLYADEADRVIDPPRLEPRPVPVPPGPIEEWAARISGTSFFAAGGAWALTRDPRRAADVLLAGIPKAARMGREGFAAQLGRTLAARGVVPLDASALRRLDRVDTVVLDSATLLTGRVELTDLVPLDDPEAPADIQPGGSAEDLDADALRERAERLLTRWSNGPDPDPSTLRTLEPIDVGDWSLLPDGSGDPPTWAQPRLGEIHRSGATPVLLQHRGRAVALLGVIHELDPATDPLIDVARRGGFRLVVTGRNGRLDERIDHDGSIPAGPEMGAAVRRLQAEGAVVAVISRRGTTGLSAADVGVNLARASGRPSWGGDLLCGPSLTEAVFVVDACRVASEVSRRSAQIATAGAGMGAVAAVTGLRSSAGSRTMLMINGAAGVAMASGTWSAIELAHRPRLSLPDTTPWHRLGVDDVLRRVESTTSGLSIDQVRRRQRAERSEEREAGVAEPFLAELANPLNPVLAAGAGLASLAGSTVDAALVGGLIGVNTVVGGVQRQRTERTLAAMVERGAIDVDVIRDGRETTVSEHDLVKGDLIRLEVGDPVPADLRLVEATNLEVDESNLTGESMPVAKSTDPSADDVVAERTSMLYEDTTVAAGSAVGVVVATGVQTETSRSIAAAVDQGGPPESGVEQRLRELTSQVLPISGVAAGASAVAGLLRGWPMRDVVETGVSLAVASVPEGLPFIATAAQLASVKRLAERNAVVRNPRTIEALGRVDVLCFDKTGTLTEGRVELALVSDVATTEAAHSVGGSRRQVLASALRATDTDDSGRTDLLDTAVIEAAAAAGVLEEEGRPGWAVEAELPFEASRGMHVVFGPHADGQLLVVKGAPEAVLPQCDWIRREGTRTPIGPADEEAILAEVERLAAAGYRVLAVAERAASERTAITPERVQNLELVGLLAFADPVRPTSAAAVREIRAAGVLPVMVTGDHPSTARAIAEDLGMLDGNVDGPRSVLSGDDLDRLEDEALDAEIGHVAVFARMTPSQKVRVVQSLQWEGRVVAMTGDGANDAPAIRLADVGVAMGERGTSAARDAADLVVTDDRLETIIDALAEGRAMWGSVRSAIGILVGGNLGEIGYTTVASSFSRRAPMNARQFLLVNLVTDLAPALAVAVRPPADTSTETLLREGPESSLGSTLTKELAVRAAATTAGATGAWAAARFTGSSQRASTVGLVALVGTQLGQTLAAGGGRSPAVLLTAAGSSAVLVGVVQTPGLSHFFGCRPIGPVGWATATGAAAAATLGSMAAHRLVVTG